MFQEDWVMRQIESIVDFLTVAILGKKSARMENYDIQKESGDGSMDRLSLQLVRMIREKRLHEAENLLFDQMKPRDEQSLAAAVDFYSRLNLLDDKTLESCHFSRAEISDGLRRASGLFGISLGVLFPPAQGEKDG